MEPAIIYRLKQFDYQFNNVLNNRPKRDLSSLAGSMVSLISGRGVGVLASNPVGWAIGGAIVITGLVCFESE